MTPYRHLVLATALCAPDAIPAASQQIAALLASSTQSVASFDCNAPLTQQSALQEIAQQLSGHALHDQPFADEVQWIARLSLDAQDFETRLRSVFLGQDAQGALFPPADWNIDSTAFTPQQSLPAFLQSCDADTILCNFAGQPFAYETFLDVHCRALELFPDYVIFCESESTLTQAGQGDLTQGLHRLSQSADVLKRVFHLDALLFCLSPNEVINSVCAAHNIPLLPQESDVLQARKPFHSAQSCCYDYAQPLPQKIQTLCDALGLPVAYSAQFRSQMESAQALELSRLPLCVTTAESSQFERLHVYSGAGVLLLEH